MTIKKRDVSATMVALALLIPSTLCANTETAWIEKAKAMAEEGETSQIGQSDETGGFVIAIARIGDDGDESDAEKVAAARIAAKRVIAGIVGGENVEVKEAFSFAESTTGDSETTTEGTFTQKIKIDVDALLKGAMTLGTVVADGGTFIVLLVTQKNADASQGLAVAVGDSPNIVRVVGFAPLRGDDVATAQRLALDSAKSQAIEMVLGTSVAATDASMDAKASAKVFASAAGFIKQFRIEEESRVGDASYKVAIWAEVAKDELFNSYKAALESLGDVRFYVESGDTFIREKVIEAFSAWGCNVSEGKDGAQYVIACHGSFQEITHPANGSDGTRCVLSVRILDKVTGREMLTAQNDTRKSVTFTGDETRRRRLSAEKALKEIHGKIHEKLDEMVRGMVASGRDARLEFDNFSAVYAPSLDAIASAIEMVPGCSAPKISSDASRGVATIIFRCTTDIDTVRKYVTDAMDGASIPFRPRQVANDANSISFEW